MKRRPRKRSLARIGGPRFRLLLKAAEEGDPDAQLLVGMRYSLGDGVRKDRVEAARWCGRAAAQGHPPAQYLLGQMYAKGFGVRRNLTLAFLWLDLAARAKVPVPWTEPADARERLSRRMTMAQRALAERLSGNWKPRGRPES